MTSDWPSLSLSLADSKEHVLAAGSVDALHDMLRPYCDIETLALRGDAPPQAADFDASLRLRPIGPVVLVHARLGPLKLHRETQHLSHAGAEYLAVGYLVRGAAQVSLASGVMMLRDQGLFCLDMSRRLQISGGPAELLAVIVPRSLLRLAPRDIDRMHGAQTTGLEASGFLLAQHLAALNDAADSLAADEARLAAEMAAMLISAAFAPVLRAETPGGEADASLPGLQLILKEIEDRLEDFDLSVESLMQKFNLSRSTLYRMFEPVGGVAGYIRERRLALAARRMRSMRPGRGAVARLAYSCGFANEAAFTRAFRGQFGITPRDALSDRNRMRALGAARPAE